MKKLISILLTLAMVISMIPMVVVGVGASTTTISGNWTDENNYDLSWITPVSEASANTVTVGNKFYQVKGYTTDTPGEFTIDTAAKLAGVAYLSNIATYSDGTAHASSDNYGADAWFFNCTFTITATEIDLGAHYWKPIGSCFNYRFGGDIIGSTNVTIKNMTINETPADNNSPVGFVGALAGGDIKNITLVNASVTSKDFRAGSFAGQANNCVLENLRSDANVLVTTNDTGNDFDVAGGIAGDAWNATIRSCVFTGTAVAPDNAGGIAGFSEQKLTLANCIVISENIQVTVNSYSGYRTGAAGGLIGTAISNNFDRDISNCYVNSYIQSELVSGGFIGGVTNTININITNCQFDGIVEKGPNKYTGAFVGHVLSSSNAVVTFTDCLNTGVVANSTGGMYWVGNDEVSDNTTGGVSATDCFSLYGMKLTNNSSNDVVVPALTPDKYADTSTTMAGLDFVNTWTTRDGMYPVLTIAKDVADHMYATADYSWIGSSDDTVTLDTYGKFLALVRISEASSALADTYNVDFSRIYVDMLETGSVSEATLTYLSSKVEGSADEDGDCFHAEKGIQAQASLTIDDEGKYDVRVIAQIKGTSYNEAGFEYAVSYTKDGVDYISNIGKVEGITTCYSSIKETVNGQINTVAAEKGYYFVVFVIKGVDSNIGDDITIYVTPEISAGVSDVTIYRTSGTFSFAYDNDGKIIES